MTLQEMREKAKALAEKARKLDEDNQGELFTEEVEAKFNQYMEEIKTINKAIDRKIVLDGIQDVAIDDTNIVVPALATQVDHKPVYANIGEQMVDVMDIQTQTALAPAASERFEKVINAVNAKKTPENMTTGVDSEGGYLVETDKSKEILTTEVETGVLTSRCADQPIGPNSDSFEYFRADDRNRSAGTFLGGVKAYRKSETSTMDKYSKATIEPQEVKLYDMYALLKVSNRMIRDNVALTGMVRNSIPQAFAFKSDLEIMDGNGAGQHLGILNSDILISVSRDTALKIAVADLLRMYIRFRGNMGSAAWFVNQDTLGQYPVMTIGDTPIFVPGGSFANAPYGVLLGLPIIPIEFCKTLGTKGDIVLGDFSQYLRIAKGGVEEAESIHVLFLSDEKLFRFIKRNNGQPMHDNPITPLNGANTLSPFVTLAAG